MTAPPRLYRIGVAVLALLAFASEPAMAQRQHGSTPTDVSAQARPARRAPARIEVRPLRGPNPLHRECVPVFTERWIPQWGGYVLYAGQRCWWSRQ
ncbi:MAG TPA: hypothetical protein VFQ27_02620 [Xanthobacteraceae bacterium]|nr:hypothetical protein [Xanthobacteraceae bacterium]